MTEKLTRKKRNVGILLFESAELLDFAGPFEAFSVASELNNYELFDVFAVAKQLNPIETINGLSVNPKYDFNNCPSIDILIIPGGVGTRKLMVDADSLSWIEAKHLSSELTISICTGAMVLGKMGLLDNQSFTTHHEVFDEMASIAPLANLIKMKRFVKADKIYTAAGISAGIDLSLHIIETLHGKEIAKNVARYMEYTKY
jgi:transcriptional regulator GlxA family with amidase domain